MSRSLKLHTIIVAAAVLAASGCGQTPMQTIDPATGLPMGTGYGGGYGSSTGSYGGGYGNSTGSYGSTTGSYGSTNGSYGAPQTNYPTGSAGYPASYGSTPSNAPLLTLSPLNKSTKGFWLWKRMTVTGQVKNTTNNVLSGEVQMSFTKGGKVVETQYEFVTDLAPGQSHSFSLTSKKACDDADGAVNSQPGNAQGAGYNGSTNYGSSPYGSTAGSAYGSTYGSSSGYPSTGSTYPGTGYGY